MTHGVRVSVIALSVVAFASLSPLAAASAATTVHHPVHAVHARTAHVNGRLTAHHYAHHYAHGRAHRYAYAQSVWHMAMAITLAQLLRLE